MISTALVTVALSVLSILSGGSASPLVSSRGANCQPNFEGTGVSAINNNFAVEWAILSPDQGAGVQIVNQPATTDTAEFHFAFNGAPTNTYNIRSLQIPQFPELTASSADPSGFLTMQQENLASPSDPLQSFNLVCGTCNTGASGFTGLYATSCTISPAARLDLCVETDGIVGDALFFATCNGGPEQVYDFYTVA